MEHYDEDYWRNRIRDACWKAYLESSHGEKLSDQERDRTIEAAAKRYEESDKLFDLLTQNRTLKGQQTMLISTPKPYGRAARFFDAAYFKKSAVMVDDVWFYDQFGNSIEDTLIGTHSRNGWQPFERWRHGKASQFLWRQDVDLLHKYFDAHAPHEERPRYLDANLIRDYRLPALSYPIDVKGPYAIIDQESGSVSFDNLESGNFTYSFSRTGKSRVYMNGEPMDYYYKGSPTRHHSDDTPSTQSTIPKVLAPVRNRPWFTRTNNVLHKLLSNGK